MTCPFLLKPDTWRLIIKSIQLDVKTGSFAIIQYFLGSIASSTHENGHKEAGGAPNYIDNADFDRFQSS
jgi:hypothetical protein